jgi:hypothetical protein
MAWPLRNKLARFASKPLTEQLIATKETFRSISHNITFLLRQHIRNYLENRCKERLFSVFAPLVPAVDDMFDGTRDLGLFRANREEFLQLYKDICGLRPDEKMLDVGYGKR